MTPSCGQDDLCSPFDLGQKIWTGTKHFGSCRRTRHYIICIFNFRVGLSKDEHLLGLSVEECPPPPDLTEALILEYDTQDDTVTLPNEACPIGCECVDFASCQGSEFEELFLKSDKKQKFQGQLCSIIPPRVCCCSRSRSGKLKYSI